MPEPKKSTRNINDAEPELRDKYLETKRRWESHFPRWELRPTTVFRSPADQLAAFKAGKSNIDGISTKGNHNYYPSRAIDAGVFRKKDGALLDDLLEKKRVTLEQFHGMYAVYGLIAQSLGLRWGNDWDADGIPVEPDPDEKLVDEYHIELPKE